MKQRDAVSDLVSEIEAVIPPLVRKRCGVCVLGKDIHQAMILLRERGLSYRRITAGVNERLKLELSEGSIQHHIQKHRDYL